MEHFIARVFDIGQVSDLHFLLMLANLLDMNTDMPVLCSHVVECQQDELEGFQMMINCYAGLD
ncbi:MAG: hypothetical protein SGPRY_014472 [Prymnesium sp.]